MRANQTNILFADLMGAEAILHFTSMREDALTGGLRRIHPAGAAPNRKYPDLSVERYIDDLEHQNYAVLFNDLSYAQIEYVFLGGEIRSHRLAYVPCPYVVDDDVQIDDLDDVSLNMKDGSYKLMLRGGLRFDFDFNEVDDFHPFCHLHIFDSGCRVPVRSFLNVSDFFRFLYSNFYSSDFDRVAGVLNNTRHPDPDYLRDFERQRLHMSWN